MTVKIILLPSLVVLESTLTISPTTVTLPDWSLRSTRFVISETPVIALPMIIVASGRISSDGSWILYPPKSAGAGLAPPAEDDGGGGGGVILHRVSTRSFSRNSRSTLRLPENSTILFKPNHFDMMRGIASSAPERLRMDSPPFLRIIRTTSPSIIYSAFSKNPFTGQRRFNSSITASIAFALNSSGAYFGPM